MCLGVDDSFRCSVCAAGKRVKDLRPSCVVCEKRTGLLRHVKSGGKKKVFCHYICGLTSPKIKVNSFLDMTFELISTEQIEEGRKILKCEICGDKSSSVIPCHDSGCGRGVHLYCFLRNRAENVVYENQDKESKLFWGIKWERVKLGESIIQSTIGDGEIFSTEYIQQFIKIGQDPKDSTSNKTKKGRKNIIEEEKRNLFVLENLLNGFSADELAKRFQKYSHNLVEESKNRNFVRRAAVFCPDHQPNCRYCFCGEDKSDSYVSCDTCQVWYHCTCIGSSLEEFQRNEEFECNKCKSLTECLTDGVHDSLAHYFQNCRMEICDFISLAVCLERKLRPANYKVLKSLQIWMEIIPFNLCPISREERETVLFLGFLSQICLEEVSQKNLEVFDEQEIISSQQLLVVKGIKCELELIKERARTQIPESHIKSISEICDDLALLIEYSEELLDRHQKVKNILSYAKAAEGKERLRSLKLHRQVIEAIRRSGIFLKTIQPEINQLAISISSLFSKESPSLESLNSIKIKRETIEVYRSELESNPLALKFFESSLSSLKLCTIGSGKEVPLRLDYFLILLKKQSKNLIEAENTEMIETWDNKRDLIYRAKILLGRIERFKDNPPQWRDLSDLINPECVLATEEEADKILSEASDCLLFMNSSIIRQISNIKEATAKFESRYRGSYWKCVDDARRYICNLVKNGNFARTEAIEYTKELKIHHYLLNFSRKRITLSISEIKAKLNESNRNFNTDVYEKTEALIEELEILQEEALKLESIQGEERWSDSHIDNAINIWTQLIDSKIKIEVPLKNIIAIHNNYDWLIQLTSQIQHVFDIPEMGETKMMKVTFKKSVEWLNNNPDIVRATNIRTLFKLSRLYKIEDKRLYQPMFDLFKIVAFKVWQKEFEDVVLHKTKSICISDLQYLESKWSMLEMNKEDYPIELKDLNDLYFSMKIRLEELLDIGPLDSITGGKISQIRDSIHHVLSYTEFSQFDSNMKNSLLLLTKYYWLINNLHKLSFLEGEAFEDSLMMIEMSKPELENLGGLLKRVIANCERLSPSSTQMSQIKAIQNGYLPKLKDILNGFEAKYGSFGEIEKDYDKYLRQKAEVYRILEVKRAEKKLTPYLVLNLFKSRPSLTFAQEIYRKFKALGIVYGDKKKEICMDIDEAVLLNNFLKENNSTVQFAFNFKFDKISMPAIEEYKQFESDLLRIWKKTEQCPVFVQEIWETMMMLDIAYKILKFIYEASNFRKWKKLAGSIASTIADNPSIQSNLDSTEVMKTFREQEQLIHQLNLKLLQENISFEGIVSIPPLIDRILPETLGEVRLEDFKKDCIEIISVMENLRNPTNKLTFNDYMSGLATLNNFPITVHEPTIEEFTSVKAECDRIINLIRVGKKQGMLSNGEYVEYIINLYKKSKIRNEECEELINELHSAFSQYDRILEIMERTESISYPKIENEMKAIRIKVQSKELLIKAFGWVKRTASIKVTGIKASLLVLISLQKEGKILYDLYSESLREKNLLLAYGVLLDKIKFIEDLIKSTGRFLKIISRSKTDLELDQASIRFENDKFVDISENLIDFKTQLNFGQIQYNESSVDFLAERIENVLGRNSTGKYGWDLKQDYEILRKLSDIVEGRHKIMTSQRVQIMLTNGGNGDELLEIKRDISSKRKIKPNQSFGQGLVILRDVFILK